MKPDKISVKDTHPGIMIRVDVPELQSWEILALTYEEAEDLMVKIMKTLGDHNQVGGKTKLAG